MNTQLQRMMVVLFLVLTIIVITVLFWLPVNDDSSRILVARESASETLLSLGTTEYQDSEVQIVGSPEVAEPESLEVDSSDLGDDLLIDDNELRRDYLSNTVAEEPQTADMGKERANSAPVMPAAPIGSLVVSSPASDADYAYDVMGNKRVHVSDYSVRKNDWFARITGKYWDDLFMWPDLYTMNTDNLRSSNPDLIFPGEKVSIYESLTADGDFSEDDRKTLLSAYLKVYKTYKQIGERKDLAAAQLLASAVRYDKDFLENYSSVITLKDRQMAEKLIKEQAFLD